MASSSSQMNERGSPNAYPKGANASTNPGTDLNIRASDLSAKPCGSTKASSKPRKFM